MRRSIAAVATLATVCSGVVLGAGALSVGAAEKKPVRLPGLVNVEGTTDVSNDTDAQLEVALDDFSFGPTFVKAKPGESIELALDNVGGVTHTFTSDSLGVNQQLAAGQQGTLVITVPASGKAFEFYCRFHKGSGMRGAVFTKRGAKVTASGAPAGSSGSSGTGSSDDSSGGSGGSGVYPY